MTDLLFSFFNTDSPHLYFQDVNTNCLDAYVVWLDSKHRGAWVKSKDIPNPLHPDKIPKKDLYTSEEKKKIKPSEDCYVMFVNSNEVAKNITKYLKRNFDRKVKSVEYDGNCVFNAILLQISRYAHKYTAEQLRKQAAYFLAKHWDIFSVTATAITDKSMESYIRNLYNGHSYGDLLTLGVIGVMWKLKITVVTPDL